MKRFLIGVLLVSMGCGTDTNYEFDVESNELDSVEVESSDSLDEMMAYIKYIDSAGVVEQVSDNFTEMKETNEKLESTLEETREELQSTREELVETKVALVKSEKIVRAVLGDSTTNASSFKLLPIEK